MRYFIGLILTLFLWGASGTSNAQISTSLNFNLDSQPAWGPTGYDYVEYYYLPDIGVYYSVPQNVTTTTTGELAIYRSSLPSRYSNYNFYKSYKVVINEREPWHNHKTYRDKYASYKNRHDQLFIRDSQDSKYYQNKNHPKHSSWVKQQKQDNDKNKKNNQNNNSKKHDNGKKKK